MRKLKKLLSLVLMTSMVLIYPSTVSAVSVAEGIAIDNQTAESNPDNRAYIMIERATGETESYALEDLLEDAVVISNNQLTVCESGAYILQSIGSEAAISGQSANSYRYNWDIDRNTTVYSDVIMDLSVGDKVSVTLAAGTKNYISAEVGLMNRTNMAFSSNDIIVGTKDYPMLAQTWTMAVGGKFSFAIKNNASKDETINFSGTFGY